MHPMMFRTEIRFHVSVGTVVEPVDDVMHLDEPFATATGRTPNPVASLDEPSSAVGHDALGTPDAARHTLVLRQPST
jgi:hypothetical protein